MTGYADEAAALTILRKDDPSAQNLGDKTRIAALNADLSAEIDDYCKRVFAAQGTLGNPVVWVRDAPFGSVLPVPDFYTLIQVRIGATDVTASVLKRTLIDGSPGPPWQLLIYAPLGVPTGWATGLASSYDAVTVTVLAGWATPPRPLVQIATHALVREWRARIGQYSGSAGDASTTLALPTQMLSDEDKERLMTYVRPRVAAVRGS